MRILVLNAGSSSVKFTVMDTVSDDQVVSGSIDDIGQGGGAADHDEALARVLAAVADVSGIEGVGHRVVHGGERCVEPAIVTPELEREIAALASLAPLHNPANLAGIVAARRAFPDVPHVAVFDTAFHSRLSPAAFTVPLPRELTGPLGIRKYGFHGTSHQYVSRRASNLLGGEREAHRVISLHLGNGSSAAAVRGGVCIDTSMGFTPIQGLVMGTRPGDVDPAVVLHVLRNTEMSGDEVDQLLNRGSGLLALSGTNDFREVTLRAAAGDSDASLALDVWSWRIRHYIGAYAALLGGLDALVFTGGIGENSAVGRRRATEGLSFFGIEIDETANNRVGTDERTISPGSSPVAVMVIPTNEELEIAHQSAGVITQAR